MANMIALDEGKPILLTGMMKSEPGVPDVLKIVLIGVPFAPQEDWNYLNFTPATFTGSAPKELQKENWHLLAMEPGNHYAEIQYDNTPVWINEGAVTTSVYGWLIYEGDGEVVYFTQVFDAPRTLAVGQGEAISPLKIRLKTLD